MLLQMEYFQTSFSIVGSRAECQNSDRKDSPSGDPRFGKWEWGSAIYLQAIAEGLGRLRILWPCDGREKEAQYGVED